MPASLIVVMVILVLLLGAVTYGVTHKKVEAAMAVAIASLLVAFFSKPVEDAWDSLLEHPPAVPNAVAPQKTPSPARTAPNTRTTAPPVKPAKTRHTVAPTTATEDSTATDEVAPPVKPDPAYLADLPRTTKDATVEEGSWDVRGQSFAHAVAMCTDIEPIPNINCISSRSDTSTVEYALPPGMHSVAMTIGISDHSASNCTVAVGVKIDGSVRFGQTVAVRSLYPRRWTLQPGSRVQLSITPVTGSTPCTAVFGDARFEA